jgi:hypothetical protein
MRNVPLDPELYEEVKAEAKQRYKVWPSAYASGWLVQEYKRRGGKYARRNPSLSWHIRNEDVEEMLIGLVRRTGRTEDLLAILADYYDESAEYERNPELREALLETAHVLEGASGRIERIFEDLE